MKRPVFLFSLSVVCLLFFGQLHFGQTYAEVVAEVIPVNPAIDIEGHINISSQAAEHRATRRLSEAEFIRMSREPNTIILDARSQQRYDELHIKGAINLSFPDITIDSLNEVIPDTTTRILIYCNNNFENAPEPFPSKMATASLNISTYIALYDYGYRNVYELGPLLDIKTSILEFEGTLSHIYHGTHTLPDF
jgi:hypothetical protein